jgi:hypothetical protein
MLTDWLTEWGTLRVQASFMLARVRTPSSPVREREREVEKREKEKDVEYGSWIYFIAFNNGSFKRNGTF